MAKINIGQDMNMMKTTIDDKLTNALPKVMKNYPAVLSAYVFGSFATGFEHRRSDLDVAVRMNHRSSPEAIFDLKLALIDELEDIFGCKVDVIVLNSASLKMIHQVMKTGRILYSMDPQAETAYRLQKQKEYFDFQHYIEDDRAAMKAFFSG